MTRRWTALLSAANALVLAVGIGGLVVHGVDGLSVILALVLAVPLAIMGLARARGRSVTSPPWSDAMAWSTMAVFALALCVPVYGGARSVRTSVGTVYYLHLPALLLMVALALPFATVFIASLRDLFVIRQPWLTLFVVAVTSALALSIGKAAWAGVPFTWENVLTMLAVALPFAGIYAMSASGLVVVYTTTGIFNFAQGAIGMLMAYVDWELVVNHGMPQWAAAPIVVLVVAPLFGIALDRAIMRHLQGQSLVVQLMVTIGLMFAFIALANMIWSQTDAHSLPHLFEGKGFHIQDVLLTWHRFITIVLAVLLAIGLRILLFRTRIGIAMRAVVDNRGLASLAGARSARLSSFAWALGCALAALAGILLAPETADMSTGGALTLLIITAFAAAVVGRLRSLPMTYFGALVLALVMQFSQTFLSFSDRWTNVIDVFPTIMLFVVLLLLPRAQLEFSRLNMVRRTERISSVRDTALGMTIVFGVMVFVSAFLSQTNLSRFAVGMCTAIVALSLVPLTGWAGQVSLAPLAFAGIGAVAYGRLDGAQSDVRGLVIATAACVIIGAFVSARMLMLRASTTALIAVLAGAFGFVAYLNAGSAVLAGVICVPVGAMLAFPAMRLQGLYLALATMAFASVVESLFFTQPFAVGVGELDVSRMKLFGFQFASERSFLLLVTAVFGLCAVGVVALRRSAFGRRLIALRDSEAASVTVGVNILETKLIVFSLSAGIAGFAGAFLAQEYGQLSAAKNFEMLSGLPIVLALVIGGTGYVSGALFAGMFGLGAILIQQTWHISLWKSLIYLAPGLAALGIIQNPQGAVHAIGEGMAWLLPWRHDAKREREELVEATSEQEVGSLGLEHAFTDADVLLIDRELGITNDVARAVS